MAAALQLVYSSPAIESPATLLGRMSATELAEAAREAEAPSDVYRGLVLAKAMLIVQVRLKIPKLRELSRHLGMSRRIIHTWVRGKPVSPKVFERSLRHLVFSLYE